jgi:hypothetical protein
MVRSQSGKIVPRDPISKIPNTKRAGKVAQGVGLEFKKKKGERETVWTVCSRDPQSWGQGRPSRALTAIVGQPPVSPALELGAIQLRALLGPEVPRALGTALRSRSGKWVPNVSAGGGPDPFLPRSPRSPASVLRPRDPVCGRRSHGRPRGAG